MRDFFIVKKSNGQMVFFNGQMVLFLTGFGGTPKTLTRRTFCQVNKVRRGKHEETDGEGRNTSNVDFHLLSVSCGLHPKLICLLSCDFTGRAVGEILG